MSEQPDTTCLVRHRLWGSCPECYNGFPQWCRGRGGIPKRKPLDMPPTAPAKRCKS